MHPSIFDELFKDRRPPGQKFRDKLRIGLLAVVLATILGAGIYTVGSWILHLL